MRSDKINSPIMKKIFALLGIITISFSCLSQNSTNIIPEPAFMKINPGEFKIDKSTHISFTKENYNAAAFLTDYLNKFYKISLSSTASNQIQINNPKKNEIILKIDNKINNNSFYQLEINEKNIIISGSEQGIFYGVQTLIQILPASISNNQCKLQALNITDSARFSYRGMHLDVCRHFFPTAYIKIYIDFLALHKLNTFHWHLTDDQGWRVEIKKYPKLTEIGSCRNQTLIGAYGSDEYDSKKYCGYYTQGEIKDIVKYASERYINIIPEIEMPGHSTAALASYPYLGCTKGPYDVIQTWGVFDDVLCAGNDSTFVFFENVLDEVMDLFPSKYIHIGGDECPKERWRTCYKCQQRMHDNNLKNENELQSYLVQRIERYLSGKGRSIIGWDEILEGGLAANATVMSWRGEEGGIAAAKQKHNVIMTPGFPLYFDHAQSFNEDSITQGGYNSLQSVYEYNPIPKALNSSESSYILGAQANLWTEYIDNTDKLEYMLFPRLEALSEILWTQPYKKDWNHFQQKLPIVFNRYKLWKVNYSKAYYDIESSVKSSENGVLWELKSNNKQGVIHYQITENKTDVVKYVNPVKIEKSGNYKAVLKGKDNRNLSSVLSQRFYINKATGKNIKLNNEPHINYAVGGAFALIDGIQNNTGMMRSSQFLGFLGNNLEAVIDLGKLEKINEIILHAFEEKDSWIYAPKNVSFYISNDGTNYTLIETVSTYSGKHNLVYKSSTNQTGRYLKIMADNFGLIPSGNPGAGNEAWLFADEIEVK